MSIPIHASEPLSLIAGDSVQWKITDTNYPADDGWVLSYKLVSPAGVITLSSIADGASHLVALTSAETSGYVAGLYTWHRQFTKATDRITTLKGLIEIQADVATLTTFDGRTHARKMLDAIESALEGTATVNQLHVLAVSGVDKSMQQDASKLIALRNKYQIEVKREDAAKGIGTGRGKILVRF